MIRQAQIADFEAITKIYASLALDVPRLGKDSDYRLQVQQSGFLLSSEVGFQEFQQEMQGYTLFEDAGKLAGYICIEEEPEMSKEEWSWFRDDLKALYFSERRANLGRIGVLSTTKQRGIATALFQDAERRLRAKKVPSLFSFVVLSPVTNFPSMRFHEKHGFERVAVMEPCLLYGMDSYQAFMYGKKLS
jgi:ribosomal protein S18 acetylase RimI-like enzyme